MALSVITQNNYCTRAAYLTETPIIINTFKINCQPEKQSGNCTTLQNLPGRRHGPHTKVRNTVSHAPSLLKLSGVHDPNTQLRKKENYGHYKTIIFEKFHCWCCISCCAARFCRSSAQITDQTEHFIVLLLAFQRN